jgi:DNA-binding winged helix-turn-helix (wHTH) protein/dipeptidyl aminopeptidase/acylaminoacyl peptidase
VLNGSQPPAWRIRRPFRINDVEIRPASNEIVQAGKRTRVKPRLMDVLMRLASTPGEVVARETLLAELWPRRMVNDEVLSRVIADLRIALDDDAREPRFIETIPKVGYRLIAEISPLPAPAGIPAAATAPAGPVPTDAVLPTHAPAAWRRSRWFAALSFAAAVALTTALVPRTSVPVDRAQLERQLAQAEPFSSEVALEISPRFSRDGRQIAFAVGEGRHSRIVIRSVPAATRTTLGNPDNLNLSPVFFPDGRRIAYYRRTPAGDCAIVEHELSTGVESTLVDCARSPQPRFDIAPDGDQIVYAGMIRAQFPPGLILHQLATGKATNLTAPEPDSGGDLYPRFAPDGARIAFFRGNESHRELWMLELADAAGARNAGSPRGLAYGAAWLGPRGPLLVAADWFGHRAINLFDPQAGTAAPLGARGARFPDIDARGNVVFEHAQYSANLFLLDPDAPGTPPRELWPSTRYSNQPEYSPDGSRILFASNRDGAPAIYVAVPDAAPVKLALTDDHVYMRPHWSQDGRSIYAIRANRRDEAAAVQQAIRITVDDGRIEVLDKLGDAVFDVRETAGGQQLIVGEQAGNAARVLRTTMAGTSGERLPLPLVSEYQVAGDRIAYTQPQLIGLTLCKLSTLMCEPIAVPVGQSNRSDWLLTGDAVWYRTGDAPDEIVRYDIARRAVTWRSTFAPTALGLSLAVRPDGRALLIAREAPPAIDLMYAPRTTH